MKRCLTPFLYPLLLIGLGGCRSSAPVAPTTSTQPVSTQPSTTRLVDRAAELEAALLAHPADFEIRLELARWLHMKNVGGDAAAGDRAQAMLEQLQIEQPKNAMVLVYLGSSTLMQSARTLLIWRKGALAQQGLDLMDQACALNPTHPEVRFIRGVTCYKLPSFFGRGTLAESDLAYVAAHVEHAVRIHQVPPGIGTAGLYFHGRVRMEHNDTAGAVDAWKRAVALGPKTKAGIDAAKALAQLE